MPNGEVPNSDHPQSLVLQGPQGLRQPVETLDVSAEEIPHLLDYWNVIAKRRWVVLSCLLIVFTTVAIGTLKKKPIYEGKVLIEINPEQPNVLNFQKFSNSLPSTLRAIARLSTRFCRAEPSPNVWWML